MMPFLNLKNCEMKKLSLSCLALLWLCMIHAQSNQPVITRLEGVGAGKNFLELADGEYDKILEDVTYGEVTYKQGAAPIRVEIVDSSATQLGDYIITFVDPLPDDTLSNNTRWVLLNQFGDTIAIADQTIATFHEQLITELGIKISIGQSDDAGDKQDIFNGTIGYSITYSDTAESPWLGFISDDYAALSVTNFIQTELPAYPNFLLDPHQAYSKFAPWVPFILTDYTMDEPPENPMGWSLTPCWLDPSGGIIQSPQFGGVLQELNNVDIILTSDTTKWSRCVVVETSNNYFTSAEYGIGLPVEGNKKNLQARSKLSVGRYDADHDGYPDPDGELNEQGNPLTGMGWFPGYAVDVETGERLNIFFGENSVYDEIVGQALGVGDIGHDMIWNPGKQFLLASIFTLTPLDVFAGGQQYVYVSRTKYDECKEFRKNLDRTGLIKARALSTITWCAIPVTIDDPAVELLPLNFGLIPNEVTIKLRVDNPYQLETGNGLYNDYPTYRFHLDGATSTEESGTIASSFSAYPNPASDHVVIETKSENPGKETISIFNLHGKRMMKSTYQNQEVKEINIASLLPGAYFIEVQSASGRELKKIMIQ